MTISFLTRTIVLLSLVSLCMDMASEMLYPVMPVYLQSIGFTALWIGILEGIAEFTVGLSKGYFGKLSDVQGKRLPFVRLGYFLSALSKPMMAVLIHPLWILLSRTTDRFGKGMRAGARDALLSEECSKENKGKVFGFHRAVDTLGAALGPMLALLWLYYYPGRYKELFFIAFVPAAASVVLTLVVKERRRETLSAVAPRPGFFSFFSYWKQAPPLYRRLLTGLTAFAVFNSSDIFLLLIASHAGASDHHIIAAYVFYNLVYAFFSYPAGWLADRIGMKKMFLAGLVFFASAYIGIAFTSATATSSATGITDIRILYGIFFLYGLYAACTEGVAKAWIARTVDKDHTATAMGLFQSCSSLSALTASITAGILWISFTPEHTFLVSGTGALLVGLYFLIRVRERT